MNLKKLPFIRALARPACLLIPLSIIRGDRLKLQNHKMSRKDIFLYPLFPTEKYKSTSFIPTCKSYFQKAANVHIIYYNITYWSK